MGHTHKMNEFLSQLIKGPRFGTWLSLGDPLATEIMGAAGYDWVVLDTQHGAITWDRMLPAIQALNLFGARPFVRVAWNDPALLMRAMDLGAQGVVVPMVSTAEQARLAAQAIRYPPHGIRSYGPVRSSYMASGVPKEDAVCFVMIETAEALENLDEIAATPGVDGLFVGPVDLAYSLGVGPGFQMPPEVLAACQRVVGVCKRHNLAPGCAGISPENVQLLMNHGMRALAFGSDAAHIRRGAAADRALIDQLKAEFSGAGGPEA
jgi:4-hydroxy-2-oxoheptanedioate aldolase